MYPIVCAIVGVGLMLADKSPDRSGTHPFGMGLCLGAIIVAVFDYIKQ